MAMTSTSAVDVQISGLDVAAYTIPTDRPEQDGTLSWDSTTMVLVQAHGGDRTGIGWTYGPAAAGSLIASKLASLVQGRDAMDVQGAWAAMKQALRNAGQPGIGSLAVSAVDVALWELKAKLLGLPLCSLLGRYREGVPVYGSGGFTSYTIAELQEQLGGWVEQGIPRVKLKVGRDPDRDVERVRACREAIGEQPRLFVDANGAYDRREAMQLAYRFADQAQVSWFEEPVSSDDLVGLRQVRERTPPGMQVAAGEYGWDLYYFQRMLAAETVDVLQADVTRCSGITGLLRVDGLCKEHALPFSAHCSPSIHAHAGCAMETLVHLEYFHDHARIEHMLFDGALDPVDGVLYPDLSRPGLGLELRGGEAERYAV